MPGLSALCRNALERALIEYGENAKYVIYPFGEGGKILKGILNYEFNVQEFAILDNFLADTSRGINRILFLQENTDVVVLISSYRPDQFQEIRKKLYQYISPDRCFEVFKKLVDDKISEPEENRKNDLWDLMVNKYYKKAFCPRGGDVIYVIGDSHVSFFAGSYLDNFIYRDGIGLCRPRVEPFRIFHIGPALAYNLVKYGTTTKAREKVDFILDADIIPAGGKILCVFGEIDMRVHVFQQTKRRNVDFRQVVVEIVDNYFSFIKCLSQKYEVYIWCPVASQADDCELDANFPRSGTQAERIRATEYFIDYIQDKCKSTNVATCLSIFPSLVDENYKTKIQYYRDSVHLAQLAWKLCDSKFRENDICCFKR